MSVLVRFGGAADWAAAVALPIGAGIEGVRHRSLKPTRLTVELPP